MQQQPISLFDSLDPEIMQRQTRGSRRYIGVAVDSIKAALALGSSQLRSVYYLKGAFAQCQPQCSLY